MKVVIFLLLAVLATSFHVRENHEYWYTAAKKTAKTGVPFADVAWNYCDYKCTTLEHFYPGYDFYIINFKDAVYKPNFSACYVTVIGSGEYKLWNTVAKNKWYEDNCGDDKKDWLKEKYEKINEEGVGIGTLPSYK